MERHSCHADLSHHIAAVPNTCLLPCAVIAITPAVAHAQHHCTRPSAEHEQSDSFAQVHRRLGCCKQALVFGRFERPHQSNGCPIRELKAAMCLKKLGDTDPGAWHRAQYTWILCLPRQCSILKGTGILGKDLLVMHSTRKSCFLWPATTCVHDQNYSRQPCRPS